MNELLQKHGCSNVFNVPEGLKELMSDITREVLREQPPKVYDFIADYLSVLLITREHGVMSVKILEDLCDCKPSVCDHLIAHGLPRDQAEHIAAVIKENIEEFAPVDGNETLKEAEIVKKVLEKQVLDEETIAIICQITRNAYRDYWYRKNLLVKNLKSKPDEPWEVAAEHTLQIYKQTKPSFSELKKATEKILAAYRGYHVRKNMLRQLQPMLKQTGPKVNLPGPPLDVAASRQINLGPLVELNVCEDDVTKMFNDIICHTVGVKFDPTKITQVLDDEQYLKTKIHHTDTEQAQYHLKAHPKISGAGEMQNIFGGTALKKSSLHPGVIRPQDRTRLPSAPKISFSLNPIQMIPYNYEGPQDIDIDEDISIMDDAGDVEDNEVPEDINALDSVDIALEIPEEIAEPSDED